MPKEVIREEDRHGKPARIEVKWGQFQDHIAVHVNRRLKFKFLNKAGNPVGYEFEDLVFNIHSDEQAKQLIKALKRARKKTFK